MRELRRRLAHLEGGSPPVEPQRHDLVQISLWAALLADNAADISGGDLLRIAHAALSECRDNPNPKNATAAAVIEERLALITTAAGPEQTDPAALDGLPREHSSRLLPAAAAGLVVAFTGHPLDLDEQPPGPDDDARRAALLERLGVA